MNKRLPFLIGGAIFILVLAWLPVNQKRVISYGVDAYRAHRPIYGSTTQSQTITTKSRTIGLGAILVDLRRSKRIPDVTVDITDAKTGETITSQKISKESIKDDDFAYISFPDTPVGSHEDITITFSAKEATNQNPVGLRFDPEENIIALALTERVPFWRFIETTVANKSSKWLYLLPAIGGSLICGLAAFLPRSKKTWIGILLLIALSALLIRTTIIPYFGGVSGGDAYNYLSISKSINELSNPFTNTKRLPGYPLLLAPFIASGNLNDQYVMRTMQAVASIGGVIVLAFIARALKLSWPVALLSSAILAFQKDYYFTSLRPEPYSVYTLLLLTSILFFLYSYENKKVWPRIIFGLCLGYAAMVRQEGFVLAAVLGTCSIVFEFYTFYKEKSRSAALSSLHRFLIMYTPALLLVLPFFINNLVAYGHPLYTEYFEGDRLQIVDSFLAFQDSVGATWGVIGSMWKPSWENLERLPLASPLFVLSAVLLWAWYAFLKKYKETSYTTIVALIASISWVAIILIAVYLKSSVIGNITIITAAWTLAALPLFLIETKWKGFVLCAILISQILIATWFHPFAKHYQQSYPLIALMIATALVSQIPSTKKLVTGTVLATSALPFLVIAALLSTKINTELDRTNANVALDSVAYRAARAAQNLPTPIGFDQAYLPARFYFDPNAVYFPDEDTPTPAMEAQWLQENPVKTMVVTNGNNVFKKIPPTWKKVQEFKAAGRDEEILVGTIYSLP